LRMRRKDAQLSCELIERRLASVARYLELVPRLEFEDD